MPSIGKCFTKEFKYNYFLTKRTYFDNSVFK